MAVLCFLIAVTSIQLIHVCVCEREREREREKDREREKERNREREREREITEKSYVHIIKMLWLSIESHSNMCLQPPNPSPVITHFTCMAGLPQGTAHKCSF